MTEEEAPMPPAAETPAETSQEEDTNTDDFFALSPAGATRSVINYSTKSGDSLYRQATVKLADELFDCTADGLRDFLRQAERRSEVMGWDQSVLHIPNDFNDIAGPGINFFQNYGELKMDKLRKLVELYITGRTRAAQDSAQLYQCLYNSLSKVGRDKVYLKHSEYTVKSERSGTLLLKVIIQVSTIDTNATTSAIRLALVSLYEYMPTVNDDITKFNQHVSAQVELLKARGHDTQDLTVNLFKAYSTVRDAKFREYIAQKESEYEESTEELSYEKLMLLAENKFKIRKVRNTWNERTPEEEKIIALEAYIKKANKTGNYKSNGKEKGKPIDKKKPHKPDKKTKNFKEPEPWMMVAPKEGEPKEKTVNNLKWHWCPNHAKWTRHKPEECKGINGKKGNQSANREKKLKFARAVSALAEESEEE